MSEAHAPGIGHHVTASAVTATYQYQYQDMDGHPLPPFMVEEYDPPTCIVCGLKLWARV